MRRRFVTLREMKPRLRYLALAMFVGTVAMMVVVATVLGASTVLWGIIGVLFGLGQTAVTFMVWVLDRRRMEAHGYKW